MMLFQLVKDKMTFLVFQLLLIFMFAIVLDLMGTSIYVIFLICVTSFLISFIGIVIESLKKYFYYKEVFKTLEVMEEKHLVSQVIPKADFAEGEFLYNILQSATKSMNDEISKYRYSQEEYKDYIEQWIHEVKLPISCIDLICENNRSDLTQSVAQETRRIDRYVEQALYYARSTNVEKDYTVREIKLSSLIKDVLKVHSKELIASGARIDISCVEGAVFSDKKWLGFMLGQIISNAIKYRGKALELTFKVIESRTNLVLTISDNGIGIESKDIKRVFDKGFTGANGRKVGSSTGIGLYLCKKLCDKLNHKISIDSTLDQGTTLSIVFPKDKQIIWE